MILHTNIPELYFSLLKNTYSKVQILERGEKMNRRHRSIIIMLALILLISTMMGCDKHIDIPDVDIIEKDNEEPVIQLASLVSNFADYKGMPVNVVPIVEPYTVEPGLNNVINKRFFEFSSEAEELLIRNGFVVIPSETREFFITYEMNTYRYRPVPSFITTDSMLHNYHLFFSHLLRVIEKEKLSEELEKLSESMLLESKEQYNVLERTTWENAAKRNMGFFAVVGKLLDSTMTVPEEVKSEVEAELSLINKKEGIAVSPLMNIGQNLMSPEAFSEDYSQYIPRGHYTTDEKLEAYFKAMMWCGRMTFRAKNEDETKSAFLMTLALTKKENGESWDKIYQPTNFFVGKADDLSYFEYYEPLVNIYGQDIDLEALVSDSDKWVKCLGEINKLKGPDINSIPIFDEDIQPDRENEIKGFRFMGQRYTLDADIFQRLIYREVKEDSKGNRRMLPKALDIPAAIGSEEAYSILETQEDIDFENYKENIDKLQKYIGGLDEETWTQNLYWGWLHTLNALLPERTEGYPSFMQNQAWWRKDLTTYLSSWTELKHDTILYAKQVYAECGGGNIDVDDRGYVEPNPELYGRLASLIAMTREGLSSRKLLKERDNESLLRLEKLALYLKTISEKELSNINLTDEEYDLIRSYGGQLEHFWLEALADTGVEHSSATDSNPAALVADVATDPNGVVLQEGTGHIFDIYAIVPVDGSLRIAQGGVYSHYEFQWPMSDHLTDEKWRTMLDNDEEPPIADWARIYIVP